jgi:hypothetical protein
MTKALKNKDVSGVERPEESTAAESAHAASHDAKRRPVFITREGDVSASVWARSVVRHGQGVTFYSVTFERSYKDRDGTWRYTKSFDAEDLGTLVTVVKRAAEQVARMQAQGEPEARG